MEDFSDEQLVKLAKQGRAEAFSELARRYHERIFYTVFALTGNQQDTDDLAQETFLRAYKSLRYFKQHSSFYTWLYRIAVNITLNFLKKRKRGEGTEDFRENQYFSQISESSVNSPENDSLRRELQKRLEKAIDSLPLIYKASFILVVSQEMTHRQAAQILNCSENTISWRLYKARKMLQEKLKSH